MTDSRFRWIAFGAIVTLCALLYGFTLSYPLLFDDVIYLLENPLVTEGKNFAFFSDFHAFANYSRRLGLDPDLSVNFILRPIAYLTFHLNYLMDGWNPRGFRAVNILVHGANALVLFQLLHLLVQRSPKAIAARAQSARFIALTGAFLFLVHPLATESVTYIVQRFTSLGALLYLAVLWTYFQARTADSARKARHWKWISVAALIAGMLTKEILFTAPFLLILIDGLVLGTSPKAAVRRAVPQLLCLPLIPILMLLTSSALQSGGVKMASALFLADPSHSHDYQYSYALTQAPVVLTYLRTILLPYGLNLDRDFPIYHSFWNPHVWVSLTAILALLGSIVWWYARQPHSLHRALILCGMLWFFLTLSITSSIVPLPDVMADHRTVLPSIGVFLALACGANALWIFLGKDQELAPLAPTFVGVWIVVLAGTTVFRQQAWSSEVAMWKDVTAKSPKKARAWMNLGGAYMRAHQLPEARGSLRRAIRLAPQRIDAYINLASAQADAGEYQKAFATASKAEQLCPSPFDYKLYYILGHIWQELGDPHKSIAYAERSAARAPRFVNAHRTLMYLCYRTAQYEKALHYGRSAAALCPDDAALHKDLQLIEAEATRRLAQ